MANTKRFADPADVPGMTQSFDDNTAVTAPGTSLDFAALPPADLARALLGCLLVSHIGGEETAARIVEVEAYLAGDDAAAHIVRGLGDAMRAQASGPGTLYVHPMRGRCGLDIVAAGGSVLLRAGEPFAGLEAMAARRGTNDPLRFLRGPACLTEALGITRALNGVMLGTPACPIRIEPCEPVPPGGITVTPRIGIARSVDLPLRFCLKGSRFVSGRLTAASSAP